MGFLKFCVIILDLSLFSQNAADSEIKKVTLNASLEVTTVTKVHATDRDEKVTTDRGNGEETGAITAWRHHKEYDIKHNIDGLVLLACIVGFILSLVLVRYVCCAVQKCEERDMRSLEANDRQQSEVEQMQTEVTLQGIKYKSMV